MISAVLLTLLWNQKRSEEARVSPLTLMARVRPARASENDIYVDVKLTNSSRKSQLIFEHYSVGRGLCAYVKSFSGKGTPSMRVMELPAMLAREFVKLPPGKSVTQTFRWLDAFQPSKSEMWIHFWVSYDLTDAEVPTGIDRRTMRVQSSRIRLHLKKGVLEILSGK